jgi:CYTH domain-containing protein
MTEHQSGNMNVMSSNLELERKFLVAELPDDLERYPHSRIVQGYLFIGADGAEVRVRRRDQNAFLTVKQGSGLVRREEEIDISGLQFDRLWPLTDGRRVEKTRHLISRPDGLVIELDVYEGALAGLFVAEVEFQSTAAAQRFTPPDWFVREVTDDDAYKNRRLAVDGLPATDGRPN